jgi:acyl-CoA hydrolase
MKAILELRASVEVVQLTSLKLEKEAVTKDLHATMLRQDNSMIIAKEF